MLQVRAGDTVLMLPGTYSSGGSTSHDGVAGGPITFGNYTGNLGVGGREAILGPGEALQHGHARFRAGELTLSPDNNPCIRFGDAEGATST
jgi:hypothetical protein